MLTTLTMFRFMFAFTQLPRLFYCTLEESPLDSHYFFVNSNKESLVSISSFVVCADTDIEDDSYAITPVANGECWNTTRSSPGVISSIRKLFSAEQ